jgi:hypothetical protein
MPPQQDDDAFVEELDYCEACVWTMVNYFDRAVRNHLWIAAHPPASRVIFEPNVQEAIHRLREIAKGKPGDGYRRALDHELNSFESMMNELDALKKTSESKPGYNDYIGERCIQNICNKLEHVPKWQQQIVEDWLRICANLYPSDQCPWIP